MILFIGVLLSLIIGAIHYWNEWIIFSRKSYREKTMSLVAGVAVAYVFLFLFPDLYQGVEHLDQWLFFLVLVGFSGVHLAEKYLYQHFQGEERLFLHKEVHYFILLFYYFLVGLTLYIILAQEVLDGLLFFVPVAAYAMVGRVSVSEIHAHIREQAHLRILLALATVFGVLVAPMVMSRVLLYHSLLAITTGSFFYIAIVDFIPHKEHGQPRYFLAGALTYAILISILWVVG